MPERLPDLELGIKGMALQPEEGRNIGDQRENIRERQRAREKKRHADMPSLTHSA